MAYIAPHHIWEFQTARFCVRFYAEQEETDPADCFEFDEDIQSVRNGEVEWFTAIVRVYLKSDTHTWREVGADYLGCCAYESVRDFLTSHRTSPVDSRNTLAMKA